MAIINTDEFERCIENGKTAALKIMEKYADRHPVEQIRISLDDYDAQIDVQKNELQITRKRDPE